MANYHRDIVPDDYARLMACGSACLCLVIVVIGAVVGVLERIIGPDTLGTVAGASTGGGLVMFAYILYQIIATALRQSR